MTLVLAVGCQEYGFQKPPTGPSLPPPPQVEDTDVPPDVPVADAPVYANTSTDLFTVDPVTGQRDLIGSFHTAAGASVSQMTDIAIDHEGQVFGGTFDALYQIDPTTAQVEKICDTDIEMMGLAFTPDGVLLAAGDTVIKRVDLADCSATPVVYNTPYETSGDLVGLPDGFLYWTVWEEETSDGLVRIDPQTWQVTYLGTIPVGKLFGLGYADDQLFGFSRNGETVSVYPGPAGAGGYVDAQVLSNDANVSWWGATTNPVAW
ncbi:MAG: hypothetical protein H6737_30860 [Alphaproteobacteria bacterium]|nr:hypothetical protein [Alphaproteobacteria bacterium]